MPSGGYRPGSGRPRRPLPPDIIESARPANMQPLQYMIEVMNDATVDPNRRDRMAIAAAPYCHPKVSDQKIGKKDVAAEEASTAGEGTPWGDILKFDQIN